MASSRRLLCASGVLVVCVAIAAIRQAELSPRSGVLHAASGADQAPAPAQQQPAATPTPSPQAPVFRGGANFVRVDAYVTAGGRTVGDLTAADFEILEDGAPQKIEAFEHVVVRPAGPQLSRIEPRNQQEANAMAADPRSRVFVVFLDVPHVLIASSHRIRGPLVSLLNNAIGQDDLVGVATPFESARDLTLARKTTSIENYLEKFWYWGARDQITHDDPIEENYERCYANYPGVQPPEAIAIAQEMIARRREKQTLNALADLTDHLRGLRDERKAVIVVTEGWRLFRPNERLARPLGPEGQERVPGGPEIHVDPNTGRLTTAERSKGLDTSLSDCDRDRIMLAMLDNDADYRRLLDLANWANVSFYPIDPRGLPVFDGHLGTYPIDPIAPSANMAQLTARIETLKVLALNTDGVAVVNSNDIEKGIRRVVDDLTQYYLLGYSSTNTKLDGKFRTLKVRVKRPGVDVRARRGYLAASKSEVSRGVAAPAPPQEAAAAALSAAIAGAIGSLERDSRPNAKLRLRAAPAYGSTSDGRASLAVLVDGEMDYASAQLPDWRGGGVADVLITSRDGQTIGSGRATFAAGERAFSATLTPALSGAAPSEITVQARVRPAAPGGAPIAEAVSLTLDPSDGSVGVGSARLYRATGARPYTPAADPRFRRNERLKAEASAARDLTNVSARLLDARGAPLKVPVTSSERSDDAQGTRWIAGEITLAPLAPGDYLLEIAGARGNRDERALIAFRIVP